MFHTIGRGVITQLCPRHQFRVLKSPFLMNMLLRDNYIRVAVDSCKKIVSCFLGYIGAANNLLDEQNVIAIDYL